MRTWAGLFLSILLFVVHPSRAFAFEYCKAEAVTDARVQGRSSRVTFPDGRELTIVGHHHGYRQIFDIYVLAAQKRLEKMTDAEFGDLLLSIQKANAAPLPWNVSQWGRKALNKQSLEKFNIDVSDFVKPAEGYDIGSTTVLFHAQEDFAFLRDILENKLNFRKIKFVGNEALDQERTLMAQQMSLALETLKLEARKRAYRGGLSFSNAQLFNLYVSMMNGHNYLYVAYPELVKNIPNYGVESVSSLDLYSQEDVLKKVNEAWEKWQQADDRYWESKKPEEEIAYKNQRPVLTTELQMGFLHDDILMMVVDTKELLQEKIKKIDLSVFPWLAQETAALFETYERRLYVNHERDFDSVMNMVVRKESGVHFVGLNHLSSRVRFLEDLCRQEFEEVTRTPYLRLRFQKPISKNK